MPLGVAALFDPVTSDVLLGPAGAAGTCRRGLLRVSESESLEMRFVEFAGQDALVPVNQRWEWGSVATRGGMYLLTGGDFRGAGDPILQIFGHGSAGLLNASSLDLSVLVGEELVSPVQLIGGGQFEGQEVLVVAIGARLVVLDVAPGRSQIRWSSTLLQASSLRSGLTATLVAAESGDGLDIYVCGAFGVGLFRCRPSTGEIALSEVRLPRCQGWGLVNSLDDLAYLWVRQGGVVEVRPLRGGACGAAIGQMEVVGPGVNGLQVAADIDGGMAIGAWINDGSLLLSAATLGGTGRAPLDRGALTQGPLADGAGGRVGAIAVSDGRLVVGLPDAPSIADRPFDPARANGAFVVVDLG